MNIYPNLKKFKELAKKNNLIVLSHKFYSDRLTPPSIYHGLKKKIPGESFLLESVEGVEKICRFSFLGFEPIYTFKSKAKKIYCKNKTLRQFSTKKDPLYEIKKIMESFKVAPKESLRFFGGFVGYLGYDMVRFFEPIGKKLPDKLNSYDSYFILPKFLIIFDHLSHQVEVLSFVSIESKKKISSIYAKEKTVLDELCKSINSCAKLPELKFSSKKLGMKSNFKKKDFLKAVSSARDYIKTGENIQVVLSQRFSLDFKSDPFTAYRYLRALNPSPYMFYLNFNDCVLAGSSPEMLLRCEKGLLTTHPIAGTRKRGANERQDRFLEKDLLKDPKEKAEHIMLVDLARNDLGRIAKKKSVTLPRFMTVERFSHVMHIVTEVNAKLSKKEDIFSAIISCFPAGTVSGAPKVRAMQIINELEKESRGVYAGSVGYFSFTNSLDTCITIRTIVFKKGKAYIQAGAGIVNDSKPSREYQETISKAKAQVLALQYAAGDIV